jgi:hypothetical protein
MLTVLKAHGVTPIWRAALNYKGLSEESQAAFRKINLRWHDLLGHASITTTERYDNQRLESLQHAVTELERGRAFAGHV